MRVLTDPAGLRNVRRPVVLAAGFFDGVHRGHRRVIERSLARARQLGGQAWVLTFDVHPLKVLKPEAAPRMLTSTDHKLRLFERLGVDGCLLLPFTRRLAGMAPQQFMMWLCSRIPALKEMHVGRNWRFGRQGAGDVALLKKMGLANGFRVCVTAPVLRRGTAVSSTRIRAEILKGDLPSASAMLGRPFSVLGTVMPGRRIGRQLGYPTANLEPHNEVLPPRGVYAVHAALGARLLDGVANYGTRPTFKTSGKGSPVLELHLLNFRGNVYGKKIEIFFAGRLRPERAFRSVQALQRQMALDVAAAAKTLSEKNLKESLYTPARTHYSPAQKTKNKQQET
jgi:riboflavin kinase / FMN adenylyltransferase